jgi:hypothetical protein
MRQIKDVGHRSVSIETDRAPGKSVCASKPILSTIRPTTEAGGDLDRGAAQTLDIAQRLGGIVNTPTFG